MPAPREPIKELEEYERKRDFRRTREPRGQIERGERDERAERAERDERPGGPARFVVQKHAASRLHYDLRLEVDGVLKSWAVPKGPSLDPADRRLAVQTEDHPLAYAAFEGTIPKGEYGGGAMLVWDEGAFLPEGDAAAALARGRMAFRLEGQKLKGRFHLVRIDDGGSGARAPAPQWLLMKSRDEHATAGHDVEKLAEASVKTGRTLDEVRGAASVPAFLEPELCTPVEEPPAGPEWVHEPKIDGYRIIARKDGNDVRLFTRRGLDWTSRFPAVADAVRALPVDNALLDGEVAVLDEAGGASFQALQRAIADADPEAGVVYFLFDCLFLDGVDLRSLPLLERKAVLEALLARPAGAKKKRRAKAGTTATSRARAKGARAARAARAAKATTGAFEATAPVPRTVLQYVPHRERDGRQLLEEMAELGLEGIVSKRIDAVYRSGERTREWQKLRIMTREELVVVGFLDLESRSGSAAAARSGVGALLVASREADGELVFRGKVGTGFTDRDRRELRATLRPLERADPPLPLAKRPARVGRVHWVEPVLVVEVAYREVTGDGLLRQPSFQGVRRDKSGDDVGPSTLPLPDDVVAGVRITNPGRVIYPIRSDDEPAVTKLAVTKLDLARYMEAIAPLMLPHVERRPLAVVRCPDGSTGPCFYQKHLTRGMPAGVKSMRVVEEDGTVQAELMVEDPSGLVGLVQMGGLEIHPWGVMPGDAAHPDRLIFDLDPAEDVGWPAVAEAARQVRERLDDAGLESFVKTTGGKGLHVVAPLDGTAGWEEVKAWARHIAHAVAHAHPRRYTVNMRKAARAGRVFIDHLRNARGATAIAPWSMRKHPGGPVAVPVGWDEIDDVRGDTWTVLTLYERIASTPDPWHRYFHVRQRLPRRPRP